MGQGLYEISLEEAVTLKFFQDRHEVKETFSITDKPADVHDLDIHFCIDCFFVSTESEELFFWDTLFDSFLNILYTQNGFFRPECDYLSVVGHLNVFNLSGSFRLLKARIDKFYHVWVLFMQQLIDLFLVLDNPMKLNLTHHCVNKVPQFLFMHLLERCIAFFVW